MEGLIDYISILITRDYIPGCEQAVCRLGRSRSDRIAPFIAGLVKTYRNEADTNVNMTPTKQETGIR